MEDTISTKEALTIIGCNKTTLSRYIKIGKLKKVTRLSYNNLLLDRDEVVNLRDYYKQNKKNIPDIDKDTTDIKLIEQKSNYTNEVYTLDKPINNVPTNELDGTGLEIMDQTIKELKSLGLYRQNDNIAIRDYAHNYQLYLYFTNKALESDGVSYDTKGIVRLSPYMIIAEKFSLRCERYRSRLGLDPLSRDKFTVNEIIEIDEMSAMFDK